MTGCDKKRLLITGVSGLLGSNLAYQFRDRYRIFGLYGRHPWELSGIETAPCSLEDPAGLEKLFKTFAPDIVIHTAALARPDYCETHQDEAVRVNVGGTGHVAALAAGLKTKLIYISSDTVYDGIKGNFSENDPVNPLSHYARTKLAGETASLKVPGALAARINIFGFNVLPRKSLPEQVLSELSAGRRVKGLIDVKFCGMYTFDLADMLAAALDRDLAGVYNIGSSSVMTKYDFAVRAAELAGLDAKMIDPVRVDEFGFSAPRSRDLSMNVGKLVRDAGVSVPTVEQSLERFFRDYRNAMPGNFPRAKENNGSMCD